VFDGVLYQNQKRIIEGLFLSQRKIFLVTKKKATTVKVS
jgi:hypothetical protein